MPIKYSVLLAIAAFLFASCAAPRFEPIQASGQTLDYRAGQPTLVSRKQNVVALTVLPARQRDHTNFLLVVANRSASPQTIDTTNVTARSGGHRLTVFTADRLQKYENIGNAFARVSTAMGGAARAASASQPATTYTGGTVYSPNGTPVANYSGVERTYDPAAAAVAQSAVNADTAAQMSEIHAEHQAQSAQIGNILRRTTIYPGQYGGGIVELNNTWMHDPIHVYVNFAGETHTFSFHLHK